MTHAVQLWRQEKLLLIKIEKPRENDRHSSAAFSFQFDFFDAIKAALTAFAS